MSMGNICDGNWHFRENFWHVALLIFFPFALIELFRKIGFEIQNEAISRIGIDEDQISSELYLSVMNIRFWLANEY